MSFEKSLEKVLNLEGGYSDHASDSGGKTRYGITENLARSHGYKGEMRELPLSLARTIYKTDFWDVIKLSAVDTASEKVALELFDTAVNMGPQVAGKFLQRSLNVLNKKQALYLDLKVDGKVGLKTIEAFNSCVKVAVRESALYKMLNALQGSFYVELCECREKDEDFVLGWFTYRVS